MSNMISFNGQILNRDEFTISPGNRAFRYGDGVFETIRVSRGCVLWAEYHFSRLSRASETLQLINDPEWSLDRFKEIIFKICGANNLLNRDARIRLSMFRNEGGYYTPLTNKASILIEVEALDQNHFTINAKGISVEIFPDIPKVFSKLSALKSINSQIYVMASIHKRNKGFGDVLLLNQEGQVAEATASNVFSVQNNKIITPSLPEACVDGVMRRVLIQLARENGISVSEGSVTSDQLLLADELFLTNSIQGIRWVRDFRNKRYSNQMATKLTGLLNGLAVDYVAKNTGT